MLYIFSLLKHLVYHQLHLKLSPNFKKSLSIVVSVNGKCSCQKGREKPKKLWKETIISNLTLNDIVQCIVLCRER
ncbi:Uncharacterized protein TCM_009915 [Theobroma cacao]|uniref:Uncharacterized protein n=1 Tax=Theobroma cacao TaxID=3641 RepID=A0A061E5C3_THECC|nr:Uncharacterized protein TCM_009915 [Theobroma cacao]